MMMQFLVICILLFMGGLEASEPQLTHELAEYFKREPILVEMTILGSHYGNPADGCGADEVPVRIKGIPGAFCSPACTGNVCPTDTSSGVSAVPTCAMQDAVTGKKYCALMCSPEDKNNECGKAATCKPLAGVGICTYGSNSLRSFYQAFDV